LQADSRGRPDPASTALPPPKGWSGFEFSVLEGLRREEEEEKKRRRRWKRRRGPDFEEIIEQGERPKGLSGQLLDRDIVGDEYGVLPRDHGGGSQPRGGS
jgi:hypothetical protein